MLKREQEQRQAIEMLCVDIICSSNHSMKSH